MRKGSFYSPASSMFEQSTEVDQISKNLEAKLIIKLP